MQCNWCGKTYTNGYGGGYCSRRCYEEGHRRTCKGCGRSFTGSGYSSTGIIVGGGGAWCSEACYRRNATPEQKKADAMVSKTILTVVLLFLFPPLLVVLYWKQISMFIKFVFRVIFSKFFWKYVVPTGVIATVAIMCMVHHRKVKNCEAEMAQYYDLESARAKTEVEDIKKRRVAILKENEFNRKEEARKRAEEAAKQKAELDAVIAAAKAEQLREHEMKNIDAFAVEKCPEDFKRLEEVKTKLKELEIELIRIEKKVISKGKDPETDDAYVTRLIMRNNLILQKRLIESRIDAVYRKQQVGEGKK